MTVIASEAKQSSFPIDIKAGLLRRKCSSQRRGCILHPNFKQRIHVRILAARCVRALRRLSPSESRGRRESRVRAAPAVSRAKGNKQKRTRAYRFSGSSPAFPAQWFYGLYRALLGEPSSIATVACRIASASLAPASGARTTRLHRPLQPRSSVATFASTASHRTFVTTCDPPLSSGETGGVIVLICPTG